MKAFVIRKGSETGFAEIPEPETGADEALLRVDYVGFCGSDLNTYRGLNPLITGDRIPGHEISATIAKVGAAVPSSWRVGQRVTCSPYTNCGSCPSCLAGRPNCCKHNETMGVQRDGAMTSFVKVPWTRLFDAEGLAPEHVALVEPLTVGGHAADRSGANEDSTACVIGCGAVGLGAVLGLAQKNCRKVIAVDVDDEKLALAREFGATDTVNSRAGNLHGELAALTGGEGPNVIVEAVGAPMTYRQAVDEVAFAGAVVCIGYAKSEVAFDTSLFVKKELDIRGSRNAAPVNFRRVIDFMRRGLFPADKMITKVYGFEDAGKALADWNANPSRVCRMIVRI